MMKIEARNLTKSYWLSGHPIEVLRGVDVIIQPGELVSLTGPSGAGKSTLLHVLGTLDTPTGGTVIMDGVDVWKQSTGAIARFRNERIGFVFQFHHLLPEFTALENVTMPGRVGRRPAADVDKRARELLAEVGLAGRLDHRPGELSGGEQQRVALARALVNDPKVLLADEPTGNLDEKTGQGIHEIIERLNRDRGITAIIVTHNPRLAERMPRRLHLDRDGLRDSAQPAAGAAAPAANVVDTGANVS
jgi:lipoprotein-releasing system ATP-binding protein